MSFFGRIFSGKVATDHNGVPVTAKSMVDDLSPEDQAELSRMATALGMNLPVRKTLHDSKQNVDFSESIRLNCRMSALLGGRSVHAF